LGVVIHERSWWVGIGLLLLATAGCTGATSATSVPPSFEPPASNAAPSVGAPRSPAAPSSSNSAGVTVGDYTTFKDSFGRVRVAGYLVNNGQQPVGNVQATVELKDSAGNALQQEHSIYTRGVVPAGQRTPFLTVFLNPPPQWTSAAIQVQAGPAQISPQQTAILKAVQTQDVRVSENGQGFAISGQVKNGWSQPVTDITVLGILYDAGGKPLDVREGPSMFEELQPGQTLPFSFEFYNSQARPASQLTYDLYVDASPP